MFETYYVGKFTFGRDEVPITYTDKLPNDLPKYKTLEPSQAPFEKLFEFPITALVHSTHTEQKRGICKRNDGDARFKANPQLAKSTSRKLYYSHDGWKEHFMLEEGEELLPGWYVWFSMKPTLPKYPEFNKEDYNVCYVNGTSFYGPWSFTFDYRKLIGAYKKHIANHSDPDKRDAAVVLRNGGTLKYKKEICYVVIVTHSKDVTHDNEHYPILQQYDDVLTTPYCIFHPKCIPPPFPVPPSSGWYGYDFQKLGHYDHIAFAINCDWIGELGEEPGEEPEEEEPGEEPEEEEPGEEPEGEPEEVESVKGPRQEPTPIFKIPLPPGEPHCYFEDCEDDTEKAYDKFHHFSLKYGTNEGCYSDEHTQWFTVEMPKKIKEMAKAVKEIANEFDKCIGPTRVSIKGIVEVAGKVTEVAEKACMMVTKTTEMEGSEEEDPANTNYNKILSSLIDFNKMTKSAQVAMKAKGMAKMADDIAAMSGHTDDSDDELAKKVKELAQQNIKEAIQKITELPGVANQIADQIEKLVGPTDDDDQLAEMAEKSAQQKVKVATQKITELPWNANQIHVADKIEKRAERAKKRKNTEITHKKVTRKKQKCQADEDKENYNY